MSVPALSRAGATGVLWQASSYLLSKLTVLATTLVLARLLTPEDFGLVALALVFVSYAEVLADAGVGQALIFLSPAKERAGTAVVLALSTGAVFVLLAQLCAPAVAAVFGTEVVPLFRVLSLALLFTAAGQVPDALIRRDLRFAVRLRIELARALVQGAVSLVLALIGVGAWAIVFGYVFGSAAWALAAWPAAGLRLPLRFARAEVRPLLRFGAPATGQALLLALVYDLDYLVVGAALGAGALGLYTVAFRLPQALIVSAFWALSSVTFPVFARIRGDAVRTRRAYLIWVKTQVLFGLPAGAVLAVVAPLVVEVLLGPAWSQAAAPLRALALYAGLRALSAGGFDLFKGLGHPGLGLGLASLRLLTAAPVLIFAARGGIADVAWAQVVLAGLHGMFMQGLAARLTKTPLGALARALMPGSAAAAGAAVSAALALAVPLPDPGALAAGIVAGALGAALVARLVDPGLLGSLFALLRPQPRHLPDALARPCDLLAGRAEVVAGRPPPPPGAPFAARLGVLGARLASRVLPAPPGHERRARYLLRPPLWRAGLSAPLKRALETGVLVRYAPAGAGPAPLDELCAAAGIASPPAELRAAADGGLSARVVAHGSPALLRVGPIGSAADPARAALALSSLATHGFAEVPRLIARGSVLGASWSLETVVPGTRPRRLSATLVGDVVALCARLPRAERAVGALEVCGELAPALGRQAACALAQALAPWAYAVPGVALHGDLWSGNLLQTKGRLTGVVDWTAWRPAGLPGVDLLQLFAGEQLLNGATLAEVYLARPWAGEAYRAAAQPYWRALGIEPRTELLDAVGLSWWTTRLADILRSAPPSDAWLSAEVNPVLVRLKLAA